MRVCACACVVRALLCEEQTARACFLRLIKTQVFRVSVAFSQKRQKASKRATHARGRSWEEEEERERIMSDDTNNTNGCKRDAQKKNQNHFQKKNEEEEFILVDVPKFVRMLPGETLTFES